MLVEAAKTGDVPEPRHIPQDMNVLVASLAKHYDELTTCGRKISEVMFNRRDNTG